MIGENVAMNDSVQIQWGKKSYRAKKQYRLVVVLLCRFEIGDGETGEDSTR